MPLRDRCQPSSCRRSSPPGWETSPRSANSPVSVRRLNLRCSPSSLTLLAVYDGDTRVCAMKPWAPRSPPLDGNSILQTSSPTHARQMENISPAIGRGIPGAFLIPHAGGFSSSRACGLTSRSLWHIVQRLTLRRTVARTFNLGLVPIFYFPGVQLFG